MSASHYAGGPTPSSATEVDVELSTQDLRDLALERESPRERVGIASDVSGARAPVEDPRRSRLSRIGLGVGSAAAAVLVVTALYAYSSPGERRLEPPVVVMPPPAVEPEVVVAAEPLPPVRFKNPFDATEVFEFPPGTTRQEAHAAVAELLLQRAQERQASFRRAER